ncbi:hypothetical protein EC973_009497 [Apophysomyces ossiformis]|uniref:Uncharacterized protein n=1 Tax=Apophysomyces ossiformis TaxID=679940 RepID=A0A8H7BSC0_9FUNG|nr:hypothetical protein EC973_009497 [Apophysomyces ossiformis]
MKRMRSSLVTSELLLVRALDYELEVELPFTFCLNTLRGMGLIHYITAHTSPINPGWQKEIMRRMEQDMEDELSAIGRLAWMFLWDGLCSPKIALMHTMPGIALGCLYLALRTANADLPMTMSEWVDMWGASENMSVQAVRGLYKQNLDYMLVADI